MANIIAYKIIDMLVSDMPKIVPTAIPVKAEWPKASEKKAILLLITIVPRIPNKGVIMIIASSAFFIKLYSTHENGRSFSIISYRVFIELPCLSYLISPEHFLKIITLSDFLKGAFL